MSKPSLSLFFRGCLGLLLGLFLVAVPYFLNPVEITIARGAIVIAFVLACTVGVSYWGEAFFETLSKVMNQSGLY